jgi:hypothetical protein
VDGVSATARAFVDAHRAGDDVAAAGFFTDAAIAECGSRDAFARALGDVRRVTSVAYTFVGVGDAYTEERGVGTFELRLIEVDAGRGEPYGPEPVSLLVPLVRSPEGPWRFAAPFPPTVLTFC